MPHGQATPWKPQAAASLSQAGLVGASLVLAAACTAWFALQRPNFLSGYDFVRMHAFYKAFFRESVLHGSLPLWNPYVELGRPFLSDIETETLYPPNLLVVPLGVVAGVISGVFLHAALAVYGGARLGRLLGAGEGAGLLLGTGFAVASPFAARLATGMIPVYFTLAWWPVLLWLGAALQDRWSRRGAALFSAAVALALLAGNPPIFYLECLGLLVFLAGRERWPVSRAEFRPWARGRLGLAAAGLLGLGLSAVQLAPFAELVAQGDRPLHEAGFATLNGMPPASWLSLATPASRYFSPNWEFDLYCGLVPLLLAAAALQGWRDRNVRALIGLGAAGALLAAGDRLPFLGWVSHVVPGAAALRLPSRYGIWLATAVLGLAASGASTERSRPSGWVLAAAAVAAGSVVWLRPYTAHAGEPMAVHAFHLLAVVAAAFLVWLWQGRTAMRGAATALGALLAVFCLGDWLGAAALEAPIYSVGGRGADPAGIRDALVRSGTGGAGQAPPRVGFDPGYLCENSGMTGGFGSVSGYVNPALERVWAYLHLEAGVAESESDFIRLPPEVSRAALGLKGVALGWYADLEQGQLVRRSAPDPRAYLAHGAWVVPDWRSAEVMMARGHDFHAVALVEAGAAEAEVGAPSGSGGRAAVTAFTPGSVRLEASSDGPALLVLAEAWYPGWTAEVNGRPSPVFPVNGWMRAVAVPAGRSDVVLRYAPGSLWQGALASFACLVLLAFFLVAPRRTQAVSRSL
jgi:hypothetical protein